MTLNLLEHILGGATGGTDPIVRKFIERGAWGDPGVRVALFWIVDITADRTFVFFHINLRSEKTQSAWRIAHSVKSFYSMPSALSSYFRISSS